MSKFAPATLPKGQSLYDQAIYRDLNYQLEVFRKLAANRSPYFAWHAIQGCIREKKPFPDWVIDYLGRCADRMCAEHMQSERAKRVSDVREMFQWIFEFPKEKKPGPGGLFDQDSELLKEAAKGVFALSFAIKLYEGEDPVQARRNAGDECFSIIDDGKTVDDRTLQRYLREQFQLKKNRAMPLTTDEWMPLIDAQHLLVIAKKLASSFGGN
jgi:hypothetical protein